jgi:prepilin-type N-terminal cleavage/methylation domain-containing protein/prepilin-type processing-associated H-X9-DG protein
VPPKETIRYRSKGDASLARTLDNPIFPTSLPLPGSRSIGVKHCGFTIIELLLVIAVIGILAAILLPLFARAKSRSQAVYCMDNLHQVSVAWIMYHCDNSGLFPVNEENQTDADGPMPGWVKGSLDYSGSPDDTNLDFLINPQYALLGSFLQTPGVFKCPADESKAFGQTGAPRVRSYSMNQAVGPGPYGGSTGQGGLLPAPTYRVYIKESDVLNPGPSDLWVLTEEDPDSINDGGFSFFMPPSPILTRWDDMPSKCHADTCPFSFVDGHVEIHRWLWPRVIPPVTYQELIKPLYALDDPDILWVARHTSALTDGQPLPY